MQDTLIRFMQLVCVYTPWKQKDRWFSDVLGVWKETSDMVWVKDGKVMYDICSKSSITKDTRKD